MCPGAGLLDADVVFAALHGPFGEDGTVQGMLESLDVPYVGAGVAASAVCMDKVLFKRLMGAAGVDQVEYVGVREPRWRAARAEVLAEVAALGLPVFVKPAHQGSSVGIAKVSAAEELAEAIEAAFAHDALVIVEAQAAGVEVECGVLGLPDVADAPRPSNGQRTVRWRPIADAAALASEPGEIVFAGDWYDYGAKYTQGGMELKVPARISASARSAGDGARAGDVRIRGLRGARAGRLLRRRRARAGERAEHDARLHADERVREADGGLRDRLPGAGGPSLPAGDRAPRRQAPLNETA